MIVETSGTLPWRIKNVISRAWICQLANGMKRPRQSADSMCQQAGSVVKRTRTVLTFEKCV